MLDANVPRDDIRALRVACLRRVECGRSSSHCGGLSGGARFDPELDEGDVAAIDNGIWLCQNHAKLIDDDSNRFTVGLLREWRSRAEELAAKEIGSIYRYDDDRLVPYRRLVAAGKGLHSRIDNFLRDIGAPRAWGLAHYDLGRMVLYELAANAFRHGGASEVELESTQTGVVLRDSGARFGLTSLKERGRGGRAAILALTEKATGTLDLTYRWHSGVNEWAVVDRVADQGSGLPCTFVVDSSDPRTAGDDLTNAVAGLDGCDEVHVYAPRLWSFSDVAELAAAIKRHLANRRVVIHNVNRFSEIGEYMAEVLPLARIPDRG
jgi:hypothetical protein